MVLSSCAIVQNLTTLFAFSLYGPWPFIIAFWIYCLVASFISGDNLGSLKNWLVNVLAIGIVVVSKLRPKIVTRSLVWCAIFLLSATVLWTISEESDVTWTIPVWWLCVYIFCTIILAIYPWFYATLAMREGCGLKVARCADGDKSFGTTKHGILFLPAYSTTMVLAYSIWDTLFVIYWKGNISGLFHNVMAIVLAVIFALVEGNKLSSSALFWPVARVLTLGCWLATYNLYREDISLLECNFSKLYPEVDVNRVWMYILILVMLTITIGVIDLAWFYIKPREYSIQN